MEYTNYSSHFNYLNDATEECFYVKQIMLLIDDGDISKICIAYENNYFVLFEVNTEFDTLIMSEHYSFDFTGYADLACFFKEIEKVYDTCASFSWVMTNHKGYSDSFQMQFRSLDNKAFIIQAYIAASFFYLYKLEEIKVS